VSVISPDALEPKAAAFLKGVEAAAAFFSKDDPHKAENARLVGNSRALAYSQAISAKRQADAMERMAQLLETHLVRQR
jgi:hypothetical protein